MDAENERLGINERIRTLREVRGLSQTKLAQRADIAPSTVNQIERGARKPTYRTLLALSGALDISVYELMGREAADFNKIGLKMAQHVENELEARSHNAKDNSEAFFQWGIGALYVLKEFVLAVKKAGINMTTQNDWLSSYRRSVALMESKMRQLFPEGREEWHGFLGEHPELSDGKPEIRDIPSHTRSG